MARCRWLHSDLKPRCKPCFENPHNLHYQHHKYLSQWCVRRSYIFYSLLSSLKTLAIDLLYDGGHDGGLRHKLKRLVQSPNSYFMDVKCPGMLVWFGEICHVPQSYGWSFSFRLLRHHNCLLARTNGSCLQFVHKCAVPTYRRKGKTDRGCVAFLFHTHPLMCSGSQVAHSVERTNLFLLTLRRSHVHSSPHVLIALPFSPITFSSRPCGMDLSDVDIVCVRDSV